MASATSQSLRVTQGVQRELSDREFEAFRALVTTHTGIALGQDKRPLLQARLGKRLRALGLATFADYHRVLIEQDQQQRGGELVSFVNAVTTNKTEFYREAHHFAYLAEWWAPEMLGRAAADARRVVRIWSAGCSTGEEPYTIAITLAEVLGDLTKWDARILASDVDTDVLTRAAVGVYRLDEVRSIQPDVLKRHFLRGTGTSSGLVRLRPSLRGLVTFRDINLVDDDWAIHTRFDVIFCRNVLIYFDRPTQQRVLERLVAFLKDGAILILGHSEGVLGMTSGLRHVGNTVYRKEIDRAGDHPHR